MTIVNMRTNQTRKQMLEEIYNTYYPMMFTTAAQLMPDSMSSVEDVLQNSFLRILSHLEIISQMSEPGTRAYILRIVEREALQFLRKEKTALGCSVPLDEQHTAHLASDEDILDDICARETMDELMQMICAMPKDHRDLLELYYVSHLSLKEIAAHFQLPYDTVKKRFQRGKKALVKKIMKKGGFL